MLHLLRRAGFGATTAEISAYEALGFDAAVNSLVDNEGADNTALDTALTTRKDDLTRIDGCQNWWLYRMLHSRRPLEEKMTLFWHGHFASTNSTVGRPPYMFVQNQLFRANGLARFDEFVVKVSQNPAMLIFLDGRENVKIHPNENYARELMELFTLGIGNYTERDILEAARALTGWTITSDRFTVNAANHDIGMKTIFGQTGNFDGTDVCRLVTSHPACAPYIARKLIRLFVTDQPSNDFVSRTAAFLITSGFSIRETVRGLLLSPEFKLDSSRRALVKSPAEFVIGTLKDLNIAWLPTDARTAIRGMQQDLFEPPGVQGWAGGPEWLNTTTFLRRAAWLTRLISSNGPDGKPIVDVNTIVATNKLTTSREIVNFVVDQTLDGEILEANRMAMIGWLDKSTTTTRTRRLRGVYHLAMTSPQYQLA